MKSKKNLLTLAIIMLISISYTFAQKSHHDGCEKQATCKNIPGLTDEQKTKIEALKVPHQREMLQLHSNLKEKRARLHTLSIADNPDMKSINAVIDEIGKIETEMMKKNEAHRQEIRKLLTPEQKINFDTHAHNKHTKQGNCGEHHKENKKCDKEKKCEKNK